MSLSKSWSIPVETVIRLDTDDSVIARFGITNGMGDSVAFLLPALSAGSPLIIELTEGMTARFIVDHCELHLSSAKCELQIVVISAFVNNETNEEKV